MTSNSPQSSLSDVLYAFSLAKQVPDAELLDEFIRRYPEHAEQLTDFAIEVAVDALRGSDEGAIERQEARVTHAVSRAMSRIQNRVFAVRQAEIATRQSQNLAVGTHNPLSSLDRASFRQLANRLHANTVLLMKLRDRQVAPDTLTLGFRERMAHELAVPLGIVNAHFAAQPEIQRAVRYKSEQKPEVRDRQTFEDAVRTSGLTQEQQDYLMSL